ncbi:MAG TPA: transcription-repair coupling factor, partial [Gammaproteobacteria bacterium]|nr:transcription-repair coupling factor [Gammaproteobacteria bacterium]
MPIHPSLPDRPGELRHWGRAGDGILALALAEAARAADRPLLVVTADTPAATHLAEALRFFLGDEGPEATVFPDWETLPYDVFSPLPELVSQRLETLHRLGELERGLIIAPVATLMQRLLPRDFLEAHSLRLAVGQRLDFDAFRRRLEQAGYEAVSQVMSHGEFAVRGSLIDLFPMGSELPLRIDLFDDEIDSIRTFDVDSQRTLEKIERFAMLPAREFPVDEAAINRFRRAWRETFPGDPQRSLIYREVSEGHLPGGIEYYLPLFFDRTATLFDYLPQGTLVVHDEALPDEAEGFRAQVAERWEQRRHDIERPLLPPEALWLTPDELEGQLQTHPRIAHQPFEHEKGDNLPARKLPPLAIQPRAAEPAAALRQFLDAHTGRTLFVAESAGRREALLDTLRGFRLQPRTVSSWQEFLADDAPLNITAAPLESGLWLESPDIAVIPEALLLGERVRQRR